MHLLYYVQWIIMTCTGIFPKVYHKVVNFFPRVIVCCLCLPFSLILILFWPLFYLIRKYQVIQDNLLEFENELAIVTIIKNEAPYIQEWIEYHRALGVRKFYLYDNESTDETKELLRPYIEKNEVVYHWFPGKTMQTSAYNHAVKHYKYDTRYMAFIDADEFMISTQIDSRAEEIIKGIYAKRPYSAGIGVTWLIYGSSGYLYKPDGLVLENYLQRSKTNFIRNQHIKAIANPRFIWYYGHAHFPVYRFGCISINCENELMIGPYSFHNYNNERPEFCLQHYITKSLKECQDRCKLGRAGMAEPRPWEERFYDNDRNEIYDPIMLERIKYIRDQRLSDL